VERLVLGVQLLSLLAQAVLVAVLGESLLWLLELALLVMRTAAM
jgi:hypothetical protein